MEEEEQGQVTLFYTPPVPWGNYEPAASMLIIFQFFWYSQFRYHSRIMTSLVVCQLFLAW